MATFDSVLNAVIPWAVGIIGIYILYRPLQEPLAPLFRGIGNFFRSIKNKVSGEDESLSEGINTLEYE